MTSALQRIVFRTGSRKEQFISSHFDLATPCLTSSASNGNRIARRGCDFIGHHGMPKPNVSITERFSGAMERWLDVGHGSCVLRRHDCATIVAEVLRHFDGDRLSQIAWVVMPNHVHAVFVLNPAWSLEKIILSWKGFTARKINPLLGRTGSFWQRDYFDRLVRDAKHLANCVRYIRRNPGTRGVSKKASLFLVRERVCQKYRVKRRFGKTPLLDLQQ